VNDSMGFLCQLLRELSRILILQLVQDSAKVGIVSTEDETCLAHVLESPLQHKVLIDE